MLIEVVACTADDAVHAVRAGAGRIELVSAISEGGLTPSLGTLVETKSRVDVPVIAMLRSRGGGFFYSDSEFRTLLRDADILLGAGADGLVVGMLGPAGDLDVRRLKELAALAEAKPLVFHRAFDVLADTDSGLSQLIDLGFQRILTSGQANTALEGAARITELRKQADNRIEILPGGGIRATNVAEVVARTGTDQIHLGPFRKAVDIWSGTFADPTLSEHLALDEDAVHAVALLLA